jgi:hypothetical protein
MTALALLPILVDVLKTAGPLVAKLAGNIAAGKGNEQVTAEDMAELERLKSLTSDSIYAREGVTPPPSNGE